MKRLYFILVVACSQLLSVTSAMATPQNDDHFESTLEEMGEEIGDALEAIAESLDDSAEEMGQRLEEWAEENADELEDWEEKYAAKWERWAKRLERKMGQLSSDQEKVWQQWAEQYEQKWERWSEELEDEEIDAGTLGELVEQNLKMLSQMPLGQLVDQVLEQGVAELGDAPWESIDELGELAQSALEEPLAELSDMLDENSDEPDAIGETFHQLQRALESRRDHVKRRQEPERSVPNRDGNRLETEHRKIEAKLRALRSLQQRENLTREQERNLEQAIETLEDAAIAVRAQHSQLDRPANRHRREDPERNREDDHPDVRPDRFDDRPDRFDVRPDRFDDHSDDQRVNREQMIRRRIEAEQKRHAITIRALNEALGKSQGETRTKRKESLGKPEAILPAQWDRVVPKKQPNSTDQIQESDVEKLRRELKSLRQEVEELKRAFN